MRKNECMHLKLSIDIEAFQSDMLAWYEMDQRDLPWRRERDPYKIWVSEIMLQQTKVDTVIPYFNRFIKLFPTVDALADAHDEDVLKAWEGLGYYSRARNLQAAAKEVVNRYAGIIPDQPDEIRQLKGVGPYTAGAIASIAFGLPEPAVDGNVMRVLSRILLVKEDVAQVKTRKTLEEAIRKLISKKNPSYFNQGMMELGATICTPKTPSCLLCPVQKHCKGFKEGVQTTLPVKKKKVPRKVVPIAVALLTNKNGETIIEKRPKVGLLANFWQFPNIEKDVKADHRDQLKNYLEQHNSIRVEIKEPILKFQHVFTHLTWKIEVFSGSFQFIKPLKDGKVVTKEQLAAYPLSVSHQKIRALLK